MPSDREGEEELIGILSLQLSIRPFRTFISSVSLPDIHRLSSRCISTVSISFILLTVTVRSRSMPSPMNLFMSNVQLLSWHILHALMGLLDGRREHFYSPIVAKWG